MQSVQVDPGLPHVWGVMAAQVPLLQHEFWHVPFPASPQSPLQFPSAPHVGCWPPQGLQAAPQWLLSNATQLPVLQQPLHCPCPFPPQLGAQV